MSNKAWERRRRNKKYRLIVKRIRKTFDVEKFLFPVPTQPYTIYLEKQEFYKDFLLDQAMAYRVMHPREFVQVNFIV